MVVYVCMCAGAQDASADQHGRARQAVVILFVLHHRHYHVPRLDPGPTAARHVHHWRQV